MLNVFSSISAPKTFLLFSRHAMIVVPEPANGSIIVSFGFVKPSI
jgi:hypothetical protein